VIKTIAPPHASSGSLAILIRRHIQRRSPRRSDACRYANHQSDSDDRCGFEEVGLRNHHVDDPEANADARAKRQAQEGIGRVAPPCAGRIAARSEAANQGTECGSSQSAHEDHRGKRHTDPGRSKEAKLHG
jgi:hypothetical protein